MKSRVLFITATDTSVGKTVATCVLARLFQAQGIKVGVIKPIQCGGDDDLGESPGRGDIQFLKKNLQLSESIKELCPFLAKDLLSPHEAFKRGKIKFNKQRVIRLVKSFQKKYDIVLIEGAGGLMVPITEDYLVIDLIADLQAETIVVSRLGLGTINHTLLTVQQLKERGISVAGIIFSKSNFRKDGIPEKTNPRAIEAISQIKILGTIPYLKSFSRADILKNCQKAIDLSFISIPLSVIPAKAGIQFSGRSDKTKKLQSWDKKYVWHPFTQMKDWHQAEPLIIDQGQDNCLVDTMGNSYIDGVSSLWVNVHGHRKREIDEAIKNQINKLSHSTLLGLSNTPSIELAKKLIEIAPQGLEKVFYSDSGSTAVEIAIKMAYQYWQNIGQIQKKKIVHLANSYHGDTLGSVSIGGIDLFHQVYKDLIFNAVQLDFPDCYRAPKGKKYPDYAFECVDKMEQFLKKNKNKIAAFVVEPIVQGAAGMIIWPKGILKRIADICKNNNIILIADEVATGFGRTGKMFACEHENVKPDIMCLAKGITGGYLPLAATLTTKQIFDGFVFDYKDQKTFFHGHTYTGNPLACAAAIANLEVFEKERVLANLAPKIKYLSNKLKVFYNLRSVGDVRQKGMMVGIELVADRQTQKPYPWGDKIGIKVCQLLRKKGVILRPLGNVIVIMPPLSILTSELDYLLDVTYDAVKEITSVSSRGA